MYFPYSFWTRGKYATGIISGGVGPSGLLSGLMAYFSLNEVRDDIPPVTYVNSIPTTYYLQNMSGDKNPVTGIGTGRAFFSRTADDSYPAYLYTTDASGGSDLRLSEGPRTWAFWAGISVLPSIQQIVAKDMVNDRATTYPEYRFELNQNKFRLYMFPYDSNVSATQWVETPVTGGSLFPDKWHLIIGWHNPLNANSGTIGIQFDNTDYYTWNYDYKPLGRMATSGHSADFTVGADGASGTILNNQNLDEIGVWNRVLSDTERSMLWNSGAGTTYPFSGAKTSLFPPAAPTVSDGGNGQPLQVSKNANNTSGSLYLYESVDNVTYYLVSTHIWAASYYWSAYAYSNPYYYKCSEVGNGKQWATIESPLSVGYTQYLP